MGNYHKQNFTKGQILTADNLNNIENGIDEIAQVFAKQYLKEEKDILKEGYYYAGAGTLSETEGYRAYPEFTLNSGKYYVSGDVASTWSFLQTISNNTSTSFKDAMVNENGNYTFEISEPTKVYFTNIRNKHIFDTTGEIVFVPPMICDAIPPKEYVEGYYIPYMANGTSSSEEAYTETTITVGTNGDFSDIKSALDSIKDNSSQKRYIVYVKNGTYNVPNTVTSLGMKNYVSIIGESKEKVIVQYLYSDTVYDNTRNTFDPAYYANRIQYASIKNMTIISKGCKAPIHIDSGYSVLVDGGLIEIDNCILIDKNTIDMTNLPVRPPQQYNAGGINVGLRGGQTVRVTNTESNGSIYAHTTASQSKPCLFEVEHCSFTNTTWGDKDSGYADKAVFKNCHFQQFYFNNATHLTSTKALTELYNNEIETVTSLGTAQSAWSDYFYEWNRLCGGKFTVIEQNIHKRVFNASNETIAAGSLVQLVAMRGVNENGIHVKPYDNGYLYGYALENIASGEHGLIQFRNTVEIPQINDIEVGDEIEYTNGTYQKKTSGKTVGYYMGTSTYGRYLMKLNVMQ